MHSPHIKIDDHFARHIEASTITKAFTLRTTTIEWRDLYSENSSIIVKKFNFKSNREFQQIFLPVIPLYVIGSVIMLLKSPDRKLIPFWWAYTSAPRFSSPCKIEIISYLIMTMPQFQSIWRWFHTLRHDLERVNHPHSLRIRRKWTDDRK